MAICLICIFINILLCHKDNNEYLKLDLNVEDYSGQTYIDINENIPFFSPDDYTDNSYEDYWTLDSLGRCTGAMACIGKDLMPQEECQSISEVYLTGWQKQHMTL